MVALVLVDGVILLNGKISIDLCSCSSSRPDGSSHALNLVLYRLFLSFLPFSSPMFISQLWTKGTKKLSSKRQSIIQVSPPPILTNSGSTPPRASFTESFTGLPEDVLYCVARHLNIGELLKLSLVRHLLYSNCLPLSCFVQSRYASNFIFAFLPDLCGTRSLRTF